MDKLYKDKIWSFNYKHLLTVHTLCQSVMRKAINDIARLKVKCNGNGYSDHSHGAATGDMLMNYCCRSQGSRVIPRLHDEAGS